jgi:citrate synthase
MTEPAGNHATLAQWEENWRTALGAWFPGERVVLRGRDLLSGPARQTWMGLLLLGITGREFDAGQIRLFEHMYTIGGSFPEPRLWNNRIAALAASARSSSTLGVAAGVAVSEATIYGHGPVLATMDFTRRCNLRIEAGEDLRAILEAVMAMPVEGNPGNGKNRRVTKIPGFGRPITARDERLDALYASAEELGFRHGRHVLLNERIETTLQEMGYNWRMNISSLIGALAADQQLTPTEFYHFITICFTAGMLPCAIDALQKPEGAFFPLRCEDIRYHYKGAAPRSWPVQQ